MIHTIHIPPSSISGAGEVWGAVAIPETKAPWALIAPPFWLAFHKLWWPLVVYLLVAVTGFALLATPVAPAAFLLGGLPGLYLLLEGHQLRRNALEKDGWAFAGVAEGHDPEEALARHFGRMTDIATQSIYGRAVTA